MGRRAVALYRRHGSWLRFTLGLALGVLALWAVDGQRGELRDATRELARLDPFWVVVGVALEAASVVAFAAMQGRLLRSGGCVIGSGRLVALTTAAGAIASSMPAGPAVSSLFAYRQYRRFGADEAFAGWALVATLVSSAFGLAIVAGAGLLLAERQGAAFDLVGVTLAVFLVSLLASVVIWRRRAIGGVGRALLRASRRVTGHPQRHEADLLADLFDRLGRVRLGWREYGAVLAWSVANWLFDCGCLVAGFFAVHGAVPVRALLLAYGAAQLASNLPITPGGLGVVEGSLTVALVAYGGSTAAAVGAVLIYRIISFWAFIPVGWLTYGGIVWQDRRSDRVAAARELPAAVVVTVGEGEGG